MTKTALLFPGQGSQLVGMGEDIYREFAYVREIFEMVSEISRLDIARLCFKGPMEELTRTVNLQPAITAVNLGFLAVLEREKVPYAAAAGHSLGEYSALCAGGVLAAADAARLVFVRGRLMDREASRNRGAMQALIGLDIEAVAELVRQGAAFGPVSVANHNMETQIVITGAPEPVARVAALAAEKGAKAVPLKVSGAWHSELIRGAEEEFRAELAAVPFAPPRCEVVLNVTARPAADPAEIREIMARQLCSPVRWYESMLYLKEAGVARYVELGPGKVLSGLVRKILPREEPAEVLNVGTLAQLEAFLKAAT